MKKKDYLSPEFEMLKFNFERMMAGDDDAERIRHSVAQDIGEGSDVLDE